MSAETESRTPLSDWTPLTPKRTIFEVSLVALGASIASFLALLLVAGLGAAVADVVGHAPLLWRIVYIAASLLVLLGVPPLIGYAHARLLRHRMVMQPVLLGWLIGCLPVAALYASDRPWFCILAFLQAGLGVLGTTLGCRVGLGLSQRSNDPTIERSNDHA
jgi:hypothetical protein